MNLIKFIFFLIMLFASNESNSHENNTQIELSIAYNFFSHQNPWKEIEVKFEKNPAIQIQKGIFLTIIQKDYFPIFAKINHNDDPSNTNLKLIAHDKDTGLTLFSSNPFVISFPIFPLQNFEFDKCKNQMVESFIILQTSNLPVKIYKERLKDKTIQDGILYNFKNIVCGIRINNYLLDNEYLKSFLLEKKIEQIFPNPGFLAHIDLTLDEKLFYFGEKKDGVVVEKIFPDFGPDPFLFPLDKIIKVNGLDIKGKFDLKKKNFYNALLFKDNQLLKIGETVHLTLLRNNKELQKKYHLKSYTDANFLIPEKFESDKRNYLIQGGIVFSELSGAYLKESGENYRTASHKKLLYLYEYYKNKTHPYRKRIVIISRILPDTFNLQMRNLEDEILQKVNGENIKSLEHLFTIFKIEKKDFLLEFSNGEIYLFNSTELLKINNRIKKNYSLINLSNFHD